MTIHGMDDELETNETYTPYLEEVMSHYSFDDVGGLSSIKLEMQRYAKGIADTEIFELYGIRPPKGIILYGPPGMGKTLLAKCFAAEIGNYIPKDKLDSTMIGFASLNLEDYVSKYVGETEKNLDAILRGYQNIVKENKKNGVDSKIVLYVDEMDSICAKRTGSHEVFQKMLGVLLKYMDGLESEDGIYWIGSTNRIDSLDPAIVRPGRFDKSIEVSKYDKGGIREIYKIHMNKAQSKAKAKQLFSDNIDWNKIENLCDSYSGAEIAETVRRTIEYALWRDIDRGECKLPLQTKHLVKEITLYNKQKCDRVEVKDKVIGFRTD